MAHGAHRAIPGGDGAWIEDGRIIRRDHPAGSAGRSPDARTADGPRQGFSRGLFRRGPTRGYTRGGRHRKRPVAVPPAEVG